MSLVGDLLMVLCDKLYICNMTSIILTMGRSVVQYREEKYSILLLLAVILLLETFLNVTKLVHANVHSDIKELITH